MKIERFEYEINDYGCWNVTNYKPHRTGYIRYSWRENGKLKNKAAHRRIWEYVNGPIPNKMLICHSCDNPGCINPSHLWLGTQKDNMEDMIKKGRGNKHSKLTEVEVLEIYNDTSHTIEELSNIYKVSISTIMAIEKRRAWKHISSKQKRRKISKKLNGEVVLEIYNDESSLSQKELASNYGITQSMVSKIKLGQAWKHITKED